MALQIDELFVHRLRDLSQQPLRVPAHCVRQKFDLVYGSDELFWISPNAVHGSADRQRLAIAISNRAAMCRNFFGAQMP